MVTRRASRKIQSNDGVPLTAGLMKVSRSELASHCTPTDCWLNIDNVVYDVTDFLDKHPGGGAQLMSAAGEDASAMFHALHPGWVRSTLKNYKVVGQLLPMHEDTEALASKKVAPNFEYFDDFSVTLRKRVDSEMTRRGDLPRGTMRMWAETIFIVAVYFLANNLPAWVMASGLYETAEAIPWWVYIASVVIGGPFGALMGMNVMHSGNHGGLVNKDSPVLQFIAEHTLDLVGGGSGRWKRSHNFAHHSYTNTSQDPDLQFEPFFRIYEDNAKYWHYQGQTYYWPILAMLNHSTWEIRDTLYMLGDYKRWQNKDVIGHFFFSALHKVYCYVIPYMMVGMPGIYCSLTVKAVASFFVVPIFLASHNSMELEHKTRDDALDEFDADPDQKESWMKWQILTSQDFNAKSPLVNFLTGGLNHQIEHHLFPSIHHSHLPWIAQIVEDTCKEYGVPYTNKSSFWEAFKTTLTAMDTLGNELPEKSK